MSQCGERNGLREQVLERRAEEHRNVAGLILTMLPKVGRVWGWGCLGQDCFCLQSASEVHVNLILSQVRGGSIEVWFTVHSTRYPHPPSWPPAAPSPLGAALGVTVPYGDLARGSIVCHCG